jgi:hypothetical protein
VDLEDADTRLLLQLVLHSADGQATARETHGTWGAKDMEVLWSRPDHAETSESWMTEVAVI